MTRSSQCSVYNRYAAAYSWAAAAAAELFADGYSTEMETWSYFPPLFLFFFLLLFFLLLLFLFFLFCGTAPVVNVFDSPGHCFNLKVITVSGSRRDPPRPRG
ncbi:unnamed protein product [Merluccius merluccius]